jgi:hypothetical protein
VGESKRRLSDSGKQELRESIEKTAIRVLRHSDIATTLDFYAETSEAESRDALDKLTGLMGQSF